MLIFSIFYMLASMSIDISLSHAKINQIYLGEISIAKTKVLRLDVSMNEIFAVDVLNSIDLFRNVPFERQVY